MIRFLDIHKSNHGSVKANDYLLLEEIMYRDCGQFFNSVSPEKSLA